MKKNVYLLFCMLLISSYTFSQSELDALSFTRTKLNGTSRATSMGGAFGALGGDQTGISINPAGIAVYRSSEASMTYGFSSISAQTNSSKKQTNQFDLSSFGFVGYYPIASEDLPLFNFGFNFDRQKSFNKTYSSTSTGRTHSLTDYISNRFRKVPVKLMDANGANDDPFYRENGAPWLPILAYQSYLILPSFENQEQVGYKSILGEGERVNSQLSVVEKGYIDNYNFTAGTSIQNKLNLGMSLTISNVFRDYTSKYSEDFEKGDNNGFDLENNFMRTEGAGFGLKIGAIYRPINELRIGVSYHSPIFYSLTDTYRANMSYKIDGYLDKLSPQDAANYKTIDNRNVDTRTSSWTYNFSTPSKMIFSVASVTNNRLILSIDYEIANYSQMKFSTPSNISSGDEFYSYTNNAMRENYKVASNLRCGVEYRLIPQISIRGGFNWQEKPYKTSIMNSGNFEPAGTIPNFRVEGDTFYYTGGVGFRFNRNYYLDLAFLYSTQKDKLYDFPNFVNNEKNNNGIDAQPKNMVMKNIRTTFTLGYKF